MNQQQKEVLKDFKDGFQNIGKQIEDLKNKAKAETSLFKQDKLLKQQIDCESKLSDLQDKRANLLLDLVSNNDFSFTVAEKGGMIYVLDVVGENSSFFKAILNINKSLKAEPMTENDWERLQEKDKMEFAKDLLVTVFNDPFVAIATRKVKSKTAAKP